MSVPTAAADDWYALPVLTGTLVRLEPMTAEHAAGYLAALSHGGDEVFAHLNLYPPTTLDQARAQVHATLASRAAGERFAYAQIDTASGEFAGTTSLYDIAPGLRTLAIGHTWLGRPWWRSGLNTESKLLLLTDAFDRLGAARVVWHTDIHNVRSQAAIARLGATREGELRKHRIRKDGSWRTTVQYSMTDDDWPDVRDRLRQRLAAG